MEQKHKLALQALLNELDGKRARHTELITVYIPPTGNITVVKQQLLKEQGTAENIKSAQTRKNVQSALERMVKHLELYKHVPEHGLAVFSGNVSEKEGGSNVEVWAIEPPEPINLKLYKCDQVFHLDPLKRMLEAKHTYGLIVIDRQEANIALLKGKAIIPIFSTDSFIPGKFKAGGQSAARFARVREEMAKDFFNKVGDIASKEFRERPDVTGIIVGGPGQTKEQFVNGAFLETSVKNKVIGVKDIGYTGEQGLKELVEKSEDVLSQEEILIEKKAVGKFFEILNKRQNYVAYGLSEVKKAIDLGAVEEFLVSEDVDVKLATELSEKVESYGGRWLLISTDTAEGKQLVALGGVGAILRFPIS